MAAASPHEEWSEEEGRDDGSLSEGFIVPEAGLWPRRRGLAAASSLLLALTLALAALQLGHFGGHRAAFRSITGLSSEGPQCSYNKLPFTRDLRMYNPPLWKYDGVSCIVVPSGSGSWRRYGFGTKAACEAQCTGGAGEKAPVPGGGGPKVVGLGPKVGGQRSLPPWWIIHHVKPAGKEKDMGTWKAVRFSADQQAKYGIAANGTVANKTTFATAMKPKTGKQAGHAPGGGQAGRAPGGGHAVGGRGGLPPWWIQKGVKPAGKLQKKGNYSDATFSKEQQEMYGVDAQGKIVNKAKFGAAFARPGRGHAAPGGVPGGRTPGQALPPWWVRSGIMPTGGKKDMGGYTIHTFSKDQQRQFGVAANGSVVDKKLFAATVAAPQEMGAPASKDAPPGAASPWWVRNEVRPEGKPTGNQIKYGIAFSKRQQKKYGVDSVGVVVDKDTFMEAMAVMNTVVQVAEAVEKEARSKA